MVVFVPFHKCNEPVFATLPVPVLGASSASLAISPGPDRLDDNFFFKTRGLRKITSHHLELENEKWGAKKKIHI